MTKRPNVRAALDYIDTVLAGGGDDAKELWDVLTALRGPDSQNFTEKVVATVPIRRAAFPRTTKHVMKERAVGHYHRGVAARASFGAVDMLSNDKYNGPVECGDGHFRDHCVHAARALGLIA